MNCSNDSFSFVVSIPLSVIINLVKYPLPSPHDRHELRAKFQTDPLNTSRWGEKKAHPAIYLIKHLLSLHPRGVGPFVRLTNSSNLATGLKSM